MTRTLTMIALFWAVGLLPASAQHEGHQHDQHHAQPGGSHSAHKVEMGKRGLQALRQRRGKAFDVAFLSQTITHHRQAVQMAQQALKTAKTEMVRGEARKVIADQSAEIKKMTGWLRQWYGTAPSKAQMALIEADNRAMMRMGVKTDKAFFEMMIPHHQQMVEMGKVALKNAGRAEVKRLAQEMIRKQAAEIQEYRQHITHLG